VSSFFVIFEFSLEMMSGVRQIKFLNDVAHPKNKQRCPSNNARLPNRKIKKLRKVPDVLPGDLSAFLL
jgi:DNA-binding transcriptional regulator YiaG